MAQLKKTSTGESNMNASINSDIWAALAEAEDALTLAEEQLHEMKSEAASEAYAFGDSGVASFDRICRAENEAQGLRYRYEAILSQFNGMYGTLREA